MLYYNEYINFETADNLIFMKRISIYLIIKNAGGDFLENNHMRGYEREHTTNIENCKTCI